MKNPPQKPLDDNFWDQVICGDSLEILKSLPDSSVHLLLSDIPYGIGAEDWDVLHDNTNSAYLGSSPAQKKAGGVYFIEANKFKMLINICDASILK